MRQTKPNFLFILTDQQRWDALGAAGNKHIHTPNLDNIARSGVMFSNSYCAQAVCSPSRASILSGLFPTSHGVTDNVYDVDDVTSSSDYNMSVTWPVLLQDDGYHTGYIGKWHLGEKGPSCFDEWYGWNSLKSHWMGEEHRSQYRVEFEADQAIDFLERNCERRFALYLSHYPPHTPYTAPQEYVDLYANSPLKPEAYYGAVSAIDHHVGRVLAKLRELGLERSTVVIFTSDHGDHFGARPGNGHKRGAYDECARVPLIFRAPGITQSGSVRGELVSNVDLMPTILELAGVTPPREQHGESLVPLLRGESPSWRSAVCVQNTEGWPGDEASVQSRGVRTHNWKFMMRAQLSDRAQYLRELYDHRTDPEERHTIYGRENAETVASLLLELDYWARRIGDKSTIRLTAECARDLGIA